MKVSKWLVPVAILGGMAAADVEAADPELRAVWVSRFEWPSQNRTTAENNIRNIMRTLRDHNFNAVLFQVRGQCDVLYPSPYEPWAPQFGFTDPGWDPLQFALDEARANGLEFHAYINTHTLAQNIPPANTVPQHPYNLHGPNAEESWVIHDSSGNVVPYTDSYVWIAPGVPQAEAWTRMAIMHVVENYDVDGIHLDRIRTPGSQYSHDPISVARFLGEGNPDGEEWGDWMRSQITRQLRRLYGAINEVNPRINLSAAPFGIVHRVPGGYQGFGTESHYQWYQASFEWMQKGVLDTLFPQIYWDIGSAHPFEVLLADFLDRDGGRHIYPGMVTSRDVIAQVYESRRQGALGHTVFSYNSTPFPAYLAGPYTEPASVPDLPWKSNPTTAIIVGNVTTPTGAPLLDAVIRRDGDSYSYLSSADGFYSLIELEPGEITLTASKNEWRPRTTTVHVEAGEVLRVNFVLLPPGGAVYFDEDPVLVGGDARVSVSGDGLVDEDEVSVTVSRQGGGDSVEVLLPATDTPGIFRGAVPIRRLAGSPSPDVVRADGGDTLVAVYQDVLPGEEPVPIVATAMVEWRRFIIDNDEPGFSTVGSWLRSTFGNNYGPDKRYLGPGDGSRTASWHFEDIPNGFYHAEFWVNDNNYAREAVYQFSAPGSPMAQAVGNQQYVGDGWQDITTFQAPNGEATITVSDSWTGGGIYVVADAMRLTFLDPSTDAPEPDDLSSLWFFY